MALAQSLREVVSTQDHAAAAAVVGPDGTNDDYLGVPVGGPYKPDHYRY